MVDGAADDLPEVSGGGTFPDGKPMPPGFEPAWIVNLRNGGMDVILQIDHPNEWLEKYPDAFKAARDEVLHEVNGVFEIRESELRRLIEAEEAGRLETGADVEPTAIGRRRKASPADSLTLTVEEAGEQLGISRALAYEAVRRGEIPSIKIGRRILIPKAALHRMLESATGEENPEMPV